MRIPISILSSVGRRELRGAQRAQGRRPQSSARLRAEVLEDRTLLSADPISMDWQGTPRDVFQGQWVLSLGGWDGSLLSQEEQLRQDLALLNLSDEFHVDHHLGRDGLFLVSTPTDWSYEQALSSVSMVNGFEYLEPDFFLEIQVLPNDPQFGSLWGLHNLGGSGGVVDADIDAPEAWDFTTGSSDVVVGVVDTGIDYNHPDLVNNMWINPGEIANDGIDNDGNGYIDDIYGWDFFNGDNDPMDFRSHGTHVAGTIGAVGNNGIGVTGVNWDVSLMALKIANDNPTSNGVSSSAATAALYYVANMRANHGINVRVTNHSWGGGGFSSSLLAAIDANAAEDILLVAAAGNDSHDTDAIPHYPSSYNRANVISVASTTRSDQLSGFSNFGATSVDLGAPGSSVYSTVLNNQYGTKSGTSMATPHVAGVAALLWSLRPDATVADIRAAILDGVDQIPALAGKTVTGGRLNAAKAIQALGLTGELTSPADGSVVNAPPVEFTIQFTDPIDTLTVDAADLTVNGLAADSFVIDTTQQVRFQFNTTPSTVEGLQSVHMDRGVILRASDGFVLNELNAEFRLDLVPLTVTSVTPSNGTIEPMPLTEIVVNFNEPIDAGSVGLDDLTLSQGSVLAAIAATATQARYTVAGLSQEGSTNVSLASDSVTDPFGNPLTPFAWTFELDAVVETVDDFVRIAPYGSLQSESLNRQGRLNTLGDIDAWQMAVAAGETLTAVIRPVNPTAQITARFDGIGAPVTGAAGQAVILPIVTVPSDGSVDLVISGSAITDYSFDIYRNTKFIPAGSSAGPTSIDASMISSAGQRWAAVTEANGGSDVVTFDGSLLVGQRIDVLWAGLDGTSLAGQTIQLLNPLGQPVASGSVLSNPDGHGAGLGILGYTITDAGTYQIVTSAPASGRTSVVVTAGSVFELEPNGSLGTARSLDGTESAWGNLGTRLVDGTYTFAVDSLASSLTGSGEIRFPSTGQAFPLLEQSPGSLTTSATGSLVVEIVNGTIRVDSSTMIDLLAQGGIFAPNSADADFATEISFGLDAAIRNVIASANSLPVALGSNGDFSLNGLQLNIEAGQLDYALLTIVNDTYGLDGLAAFNGQTTGNVSAGVGAIHVTAPISALIEETVEVVPGLLIEFDLLLAGQLVGTVSAGDAVDVYTLTVAEGELVTARTSTLPFGGLNQDIDPSIEILSPSGATIAFDADSASDGRNAVARFLATEAGTYQILVRSEGGFGEYQLDVDRQSVVTRVADGGLSHLNVVGTDLADEISLSDVGGSDVTVSIVTLGGESVATSATFASVTGDVRVLVGAGNDRVDGGSLSGHALTALGGAGHDELIGGSLDDALYGDHTSIAGLSSPSLAEPTTKPKGNDTLTGNAGADDIYGDVSGAEGGSDLIDGGVGNDFILAGGGVDNVDGGADDDLVSGDGAEGGGTTLHGGAGNDVVIKGTANRNGDLIDGGAGEDLIIGGQVAVPGSLRDLHSAWSSGLPFAQRVTSLDPIAPLDVLPYIVLSNILYVYNGATADTVDAGADTDPDWLIVDLAFDTVIDLGIEDVITDII